MRTALWIVASVLLASPAFGAETEVPTGRIAVLVQTTSNAPALHAIVDRVYETATVVEPDAIRSVMTDDEKGLLTDALCERYRAKIGADRFLVLEPYTTPAGARILRLRAFDRTGAVHRKTLEVTDETVADRLTRTLEGLPTWRPKEASVSDWIGLAKTDDVAFFDVNLFGGRKMLSKSDWGALATQDEVGLYGTFGGSRWPVHLALEAFGSRASDGDASATIVEVGVGARRIFDIGPVRPYLGFGGDFVRADYIVRTSAATDVVKKDRGTGWWIGAGATYRMGRYGNVGAQLRYSSAEVGIGSRSVSAGGIHAGVTLGLGSQNPTRK